jgi:hypothetical protein
MTGNIQKMVEAAHVYFTKGLKQPEVRATKILFATWSMYVVGGIVGGAIATCAGTFCVRWSLTPCALLYGVGMASMQAEPKPSQVKPEPPKKAPPTSETTSATDTTAPTPAPPTASAYSAAVPAAPPTELTIAVVADGGSAVETYAPAEHLKEDSVDAEHPVSPADGRRELGEVPQM